MRRVIAKSVTALFMIACAQLALGADDGQLKLGLRFDRSLSQTADPYPGVSRTPERFPFIQRESAFDYIVDANHWVFERRAAAMSYDSRERLSPFSPPQRELAAFWSPRRGAPGERPGLSHEGSRPGQPALGRGRFRRLPVLSPLEAFPRRK